MLKDVFEKKCRKLHEEFEKIYQDHRNGDKCYQSSISIFIVDTFGTLHSLASDIAGINPASYKDRINKIEERLLFLKKLIKLDGPKTTWKMPVGSNKELVELFDDFKAKKLGHSQFNVILSGVNENLVFLTETLVNTPTNEPYFDSIMKSTHKMHTGVWVYLEKSIPSNIDIMLKMAHQ